MVASQHSGSRARRTSVSLKSAWTPEGVPGQSERLNETLRKKTKNRKRKIETKIRLGHRAEAWRPSIPGLQPWVSLAVLQSQWTGQNAHIANTSQTHLTFHLVGLGIELRSSELAASTFIHRAFSSGTPSQGCYWAEAVVPPSDYSTGPLTWIFMVVWSQHRFSWYRSPF